MFLFIFSLLSSVPVLSSIVLSSFLFPLSSFCYLYKASFCIRTGRLKYGVVLLTSYIPRIAVTLFLQFVFVITNNKIKCCSRNETFYPFHHSSKFVTYISIIFVFDIFPFRYFSFVPFSIIP